MKRIFALFICVALTFSLAGCVVLGTPKTEPVPEIFLINGGESDYVITVPANAQSTDSFAASEIQSYIEKISGTKLEIVTDASAASGKEIIIGNTARENTPKDPENDGFVIKTVDDNVYITGSGRGIIYGVYEFLEKYLGCRFFTADCETVPSASTVGIPAIEEDKQVPAFEYRDSYWAALSETSIRMKLKLNVGFDNAITQELGGQPQYIFRCHSLGILANGAHSYEKQPCLTDEKVYQTVLANALSYIKNNPTATIISVSQDDGAKFCTCENCTAVNNMYGGTPAGSLMAFVNRIAGDIGEKYPNIKIHTFAYQDTRTPPTGIEPADNVIVELCSIESCFSHPLSECRAERGNKDTKFADDLLAWSKICKNLYIWDYTTDFANYIASFPNFNVLRQNAAFFASNNVKGLFEQGNYQGGENGEFGELRAYLLAKVMWNPYMTEEEYNTYMDEFLEAFYGNGWRNVRSYIDLMQSLTANKHVFIYDGFLSMYPSTPVRISRADKPVIPQEEYDNYQTTNWLKYEKKINHVESALLNRGGALWEAALNEAQTDKQRANVEKSSIQYFAYVSEFMDYVKSSGVIWNDLRFYLQENGPEILEIVKQQYDAKILENNTFLYELMKKYNVTQIAEWRQCPAEPDLLTSVDKW